jgi:hypothetical protein
VSELRLPRERCAELADALLPGSRVEALDCDIDANEAKRLAESLDEWAIDRLRIVSGRLDAPFELRGGQRPHLESVTKPTQLFTPCARCVICDRLFGEGELKLLRSIDMSALQILEFPGGVTLSSCSALESASSPRVCVHCR